MVKCLTVFVSVLNQAVGWGWKWPAAGGAWLGQGRDQAAGREEEGEAVQVWTEPRLAIQLDLTRELVCHGWQRLGH